MSYGALGSHAITALSKGLGQAGTWMNTGEGGLSKHHLSGDADIIFQIGPGLFGVRDKSGEFDMNAFQSLANEDTVKAFEIKLAQGAKQEAAICKVIKSHKKLLIFVMLNLGRRLIPLTVLNL